MTEPNQNDAEGTERHTDALVVTMSSLIVSKRKADGALEIDVDETDDTPDGTRKSAPDIDSPAHLPATCLAAVLNFMWYTDVRQCMLTGRIMAVEAARHVETLNITKASELVVPAARRFGNAQKVNILCLVSEISKNNRDDQISMDAVMRVVPFLSFIPKLEHIFLGGLYLESEAVWSPYVYDINNFVAPRDHRDIFKSLLQSFIGGFQTRSLAQSLTLDGILQHYQLECADNGRWREDPDRPCQFCHKIFTAFPIHSLLNLDRDRSFCLSRADCIRAVFRRDGAEALLRSNDGAAMLLSCLKYEIPRTTWRSSKSKVDESFVQKMRSQDGEGIYTDVNGGDIVIMNWHRHASNNDSFKDFLDLVKRTPLLLDVIKGIPKNTILETFEDDGKAIFVRQTFEALLNAGLNLNVSDYIIVDPEKEPALARRDIHVE